MNSILFGDGFNSFFRDIVFSTKEFLGDTWDIIYSFLAQYFSEAVIYLLVGGLLVAISLILILKAMNNK